MHILSPSTAFKLFTFQKLFHILPKVILLINVMMSLVSGQWATQNIPIGYHNWRLGIRKAKKVSTYSSKQLFFVNLLNSNVFAIFIATITLVVRNFSSMTISLSWNFSNFAAVFHHLFPIFELPFFTAHNNSNNTCPACI